MVDVNGASGVELSSVSNDVTVTRGEPRVDRGEALDAVAVDGGQTGASVVVGVERRVRERVEPRGAERCGERGHRVVRHAVDIDGQTGVTIDSSRHDVSLTGASRVVVQTHADVVDVSGQTGVSVSSATTT